MIAILSTFLLLHGAVASSGSCLSVPADKVQQLNLKLCNSGPSTCGVKGLDNTPWGGSKIVNGQTATPCEWPWQVGLKYSSSSGYFCGGTLVAERWVFSAAHCTASGSTNFQVVVGDHNMYSNSDMYQQIHAVEAVYNHPQYTSTSGSGFDFVLIKLAMDVELNSCVSPACMPQSQNENVNAGDLCFITGWGTLSSGGGQPSQLQEAEVAVVSNNACFNAYGGYINPSMVCAQGLNSAGQTTDACQGDSGGPMVCQASDGAWVLHGATSWGIGCASAQYPGVWSRVSEVVPWANGIMSQN